MKKEATLIYKTLLSEGKKKGYLTHADIADHMHEQPNSETFDSIIKTLNDAGMPVFEETPSAADLLLTETPINISDDEENDDSEVVESLLSVEDRGRFNDLVRMYMHEMGSIELLTREGEIEIAKRIDRGLRTTTELIADLPAASARLLGEFEEMKKGGHRLSLFISSLYRDDDNEGALAQQASDAAEKSDNQLETQAGRPEKKRRGSLSLGGALANGSEVRGDETLEDNRAKDAPPKPPLIPSSADIEKASLALAKSLAKFCDEFRAKSMEEAEVRRHMKASAKTFLTFRFASNFIDHMVHYLEDTVKTIEKSRDQIRRICIEGCGMPAEEFDQSFPGNETNTQWARSQGRSDSHLRDAFRRFSDRITTEQERLLALSEKTSLPCPCWKRPISTSRSVTLTPAKRKKR